MTCDLLSTVEARLALSELHRLGLGVMTLK